MSAGDSFQSRVDEKKALSELNDRLAEYLKHARGLEAEIQRLKELLREKDESHRLKLLELESEIAELTKERDMHASSCTRYERQLQMIDVEVSDMRRKCDQRGGELTSVVADRDQLQKRILRLQKDFDASEIEKLTLQRDLDAARSNLQPTLDKIETLKARLQEEIKLREEWQRKASDLSMVDTSHASLEKELRDYRCLLEVGQTSLKHRSYEGDDLSAVDDFHEALNHSVSTAKDLSVHNETGPRPAAISLTDPSTSSLSTRRKRRRMIYEESAYHHSDSNKSTSKCSVM